MGKIHERLLGRKPLPSPPVSSLNCEDGTCRGMRCQLCKGRHYAGTQRRLLDRLPREPLTVYVVTISERRIHLPQHYDFWLGRLKRWAADARRWGWVYPHYTNDIGELHPHYHVGIIHGARGLIYELQEVFDCAGAPVAWKSVWRLEGEQEKARALNYIIRGERSQAARLLYQPSGFQALRRFGDWPEGVTDYTDWGIDRHLGLLLGAKRMAQRFLQECNNDFIVPPRIPGAFS